MVAVHGPASGDRHPAKALLHPLRPVARGLLRLHWDVRTLGDHHVPRRGGAILAANHIGFIDGPLLALFSPRPVHALTKQEMFEGKLGGFLKASGQIPLNRFAADPGAIKTCLRVLRDGGVAGIFPEGTRGDGTFARFHHGAAYLALVTGAPVVPVTMLGTREPGAASASVPGRRARMQVVFGEPFETTARPWPRTREQVVAHSALLLGHMQDQLAHALRATGATLPGPLPAGQQEDDPDTGFVQQGAP